MDDNLVTGTNISAECNICYETCVDVDNLLTLKCCMNTKKICIKCINCLSVPSCPYCRRELDDECKAFIKEPTIVRSVPVTSNTYIHNYIPYSFDDFIREENVIDPSLYNDSRRLRRQMRRLRHEYNQRRNAEPRNDTLNHQRSAYRSSRHHRNQHNRNTRHFLQNESNNITRLYNSLNRAQDNVDLDDHYLFDIEF